MWLYYFACQISPYIFAVGFCLFYTLSYNVLGDSAHQLLRAADGRHARCDYGMPYRHMKS